jgi:predicted DsbA family dithiol-disulfide isomerase
MPQLEVFFDYNCPHCLRGHHNLLELLPSFPDIEVVWRPCEAHPRPENHGVHSDLCMQGMFFAADADADILAYHARMFDLAHKVRANLEDIDVLAENVGDIVDAKAFAEALRSGKYREVQEGHNDYAYEQSGVWVLPAYRLDGRKLDSVEGVGVSREQLESFLAGE